MVGIKLLHLYRELNLTHLNELRLRCAEQSDKRFKILESLLEKKVDDPEELIACLKLLIDKQWPKSIEFETKFRRLSLFICEQFELVIIDELLKGNSVLKNTLVAKAIEKKGNLALIKHYYEKLYKAANKSEDAGLKSLSLSGKMRMSYASQNENDLAEALNRNEELLEVLKEDYKAKIVDYYYHCSNIYLEQNSLLTDKRDRLHEEVIGYLKQMENPIHKASLYLSLVKFNYNNDKLSVFLEKANKEMKQVKSPNHEFYDLERKIRFLELRLHFFSGKDLEYLIELTDNVVEHFDGYSIINNNVLFYRILFTILNGDFVKANMILQESKIYFQGDSKIHRQFLQALLYEREDDIKKAKQLLNQIMYTDNYLVAIFSRLLFIKILSKREMSALLKTTIESTQRLIDNNKSNLLGKEGHEYVLNKFRTQVKKSSNLKNNSAVKLTVLHKYLLE
jgi:hypothetical protein